MKGRPRLFAPLVIATRGVWIQHTCFELRDLWSGDTEPEKPNLILEVPVRAKRGIEEIRKLFDLEGKVAVVTGASGALGRAVSMGLAVHGVDIVACSNEQDGLDELAEEIRETTGRKALPVFCDVTDTESVDQMVSRAVAEFGKIDILFTAAGMAHRERLVRWGSMTGSK